MSAPCRRPLMGSRPSQASNRQTIQAPHPYQKRRPDLGSGRSFVDINQVPGGYLGVARATWQQAAPPGDRKMPRHPALVPVFARLHFSAAKQHKGENEQGERDESDAQAQSEAFPNDRSECSGPLRDALILIGTIMMDCKICHELSSATDINSIAFKRLQYVDVRNLDTR